MVQTLVAAVLAFYYGKEVMYGFKYPGTSYSVNPEQIALWCVLAVAAGVVAGLVFGPIGRPDLRGSLGTAAAAGLLVGEVVRRLDRPDGVVFTVITVLAIAFVLARGVRSARQAGHIAGWTIPLGPAGYLLVSAPDVLEQMVVFV